MNTRRLIDHMWSSDKLYGGPYRPDSPRPYGCIAYLVYLDRVGKHMRYEHNLQYRFWQDRVVWTYIHLAMQDLSDAPLVFFHSRKITIIIGQVCGDSGAVELSVSSKNIDESAARRDDRGHLGFKREQVAAFCRNEIGGTSLRSASKKTQ